MKRELCLVVSLIAASAHAQYDRNATMPLAVQPPGSRFAFAQPLPGAAPILIDRFSPGPSIAQILCKDRGVQARILWIDATANLGRLNTEEKIVALASRIRSSGFNTVVLDVKPISGQTLYPSAFALKLTGWRNQTLPIDFDPVAVMAREAKKQGLLLIASMNAFSEGHRDAQLPEKVGPSGLGFEHPEWQTILYEPVPFVRSTTIFKPTYALQDLPNQMPASDKALGVFTSPIKLPTRLPADAIASVVDATGRVLAQVDASSLRSPLGVEIPTGGSALVGSGAGAEFLKQFAKPNDLLEFDSSASFVPIGQRLSQQIPLITNPYRSDVQDRITAMVKEVLRYDVGGVMFDDRLRFGGINADFSPEAQQSFEMFVGKRLAWPQDVLKFTILPDLTRGIQPGPFYDAWLVWRAKQTRDFVAKIRKTVDESKPGALFGVYAGSWYGEYPSLGSNYGSNELQAGFSFLTPEYQKTGFAGLLDFLITGCYYRNATISDAMAKAQPVGLTVEASGMLSNRIVRDQTFTVAGISVDQFKGDRDGLARALQAAAATTQGVMVFDLSHDVDTMWDLFATVFGPMVRQPFTERGLLADIRRRRDREDRLNRREPPVVIFGGASGIGQ